MLIFLLNFFLIIVFVLIGVAFFTLMERKILGYIHLRMGPNKVGFMGIFQPFSDAIKLFSKEFMKVMKVNFFYYFFSPLSGLFFIILIFSIFPFWGFNFSMLYSIILFFCLSSLMVYSLLFMGWSSFSKYSSLGAYRAVSQSISYEVGMIFLLIGLCWFISSYNFLNWLVWQTSYWFFFMCFPSFFSWLIICLAESNRTPFDFSEGESELVSGFNTEYSGGLFSLIFISEYASILFLCMFTSVYFLGGGFFVMLKAFFVSFFYVWVRGSFPRLRYDKLMMMFWKGILPLIIGILLYYFFMSIFF